MDNQKNKIFFLLALPRSGNTLFGSIMNQNPDIGVTANSIILGIFSNILQLKKSDIFQNFPDGKSLDNVLLNVFNNYYKDWNRKYIIDRSPIMIPGNLNVVKKYLNQPIKVIIIWRDLLDVIASFIKWFENEPTAYPNRYGKTIEEKIWYLMKNDGIIAKDLTAIQNSLQPENKSLCHFLKYNDLILNPEIEINKIYNFLEIPKFNHNFKTLNQFQTNGMSYNDRVVGHKMHTIKTELKLEDNPYKKLIPESIVREYGHITL